MTVYKVTDTAELECYHNRKFTHTIDSSMLLLSVPSGKYHCDPKHEALVYNPELPWGSVYVASKYDLEVVVA